MQRRKFLQWTGAGCATGVLAACGGGGSSLSADEANAPVAQALRSRSGTSTSSGLVGGTAVKSRVIVVGGGMGGATVAKYLRLWGDGIAVTLVDRMPTYTSNIMSSLVLTGQRTLSSLGFNYDTLRTRYGVQTVFSEVRAIDPVAVKVTLADGSTLSADRIVLAPGIDFDAVPGLARPDAMPHAWKAGPQTTLLAQQLAAMPAGGTVILTIPRTPYRCPPGPYERACLIADWLRVKKPGSKLLVLDANPDYVVEKDNFSRAFTQLHAGVVTYVNSAEVLSADSTSMNLTTTQGVFHGDVINLIPRQRAGALIAASGLANATEGRFAGVNVLSYASTVAGADKVHVLGDASATTQPKAGHIANQEAKVCADAISRLLAGGAPDPAPVTNSACFSTITMSQASWLSAGYQYDGASSTMKLVAESFGASSGWSQDNFDEMGTWFKALMADSFA